MAAFLSCVVVGYLWLINHNNLRFMVYWLMSIRQHGPRRDGGKKNISRSGCAYMCAYVFICFKLKNRSKPSRMKAVRFPIFMRL